jgi:hypothetical protein
MFVKRSVQMKRTDSLRRGKGIRKKRRARTGEAVKVYRDGREVCNDASEAGKRDYQTRITLMWLRDNGKCCICHRPVPLEEATFEHADGRGMGGGRRDDRIEYTKPNGARVQNGVAHGRCNREAGSPRRNRG